MNEQNVLQQVKDYVIENFMYMRKVKTVAEDESLLRTGVITSLGMMEVVGWVEETFGLSVDPDEITEQIAADRAYAGADRAPRNAPLAGIGIGDTGCRRGQQDNRSGRHGHSSGDKHTHSFRWKNEASTGLGKDGSGRHPFRSPVECVRLEEAVSRRSDSG